MKRIFVILLAVTLFFSFGCSATQQTIAPLSTATQAPTAAPTPTPEPTPTPSPAPPDGLSSQPFDFLENTYALWRVVRHSPADGMVQYDVQLLAINSTIHCSITIENDQATAVHPAYTFELIQPNGDSLSSADSAIYGSADVDGFATSFDASSEFALAQYVLVYTFELPEQDALPTVAQLSYPREDALATIEFSNPILVDAES